MRAMSQSAFGDSSVFNQIDLADPEPLPGEVLVEVRATSVNPVDVGVRRGDFPLLGDPPFLLGWDVSGVVVRTNPETFAAPSVGDEVFGFIGFPRQGGANAELVTAPTRHLVAKPSALTPHEAAALPLGGLTAWQTLVDTAQLEAGQRVLIHGGGGGVGHIAVQIAVARGAEVITTASASKHDWLHDLGASSVIDYRKEDFVTEAGPVDVVLDTVGTARASDTNLEGAAHGDGLEHFDRSLEVLVDDGLFVTIVDQFQTQLVDRAMDKGRRFAGVVVQPDHEGMAGLAELVERAALRPRVDEVFPITDLASAHDRLSAGGTAGKVVVALDW